MGIARDSRHKRRHTGGKRKSILKSRKYELGRQAANTKIGAKRIHLVRCRGGNLKYRAMRLETGNFSWGSEVISRKTRILDVVYNASNNEMVRTKTLVKNAIVQIDAAPFRAWYKSHFGIVLGKKKSAKGKGKGKGEEEEVKKSGRVLRKLAKRRKQLEGNGLTKALNDQFMGGRLLAAISSRPGQCGRADGYVLEGPELAFYQRKMKAKKGK